MKKKLSSLLTPLIVLWIFVVLGFYYWGHQASLKGPVIGLARALGLLLVSAVLGVVALSGGYLLSELLRLSYASQAEAIVFCLGLGMGFMALLTLGLGFVGGLRPWVFWGLTGVWVVVALPGLYRVWRRIPFDSGADAEPLRRFDVFLLVVLAIELLVGLQIALSPPIGWDALTTHLVLVREALDAGRLLTSFLFDRPLVGHLLFIWGAALGGEVMPQLISYWQSVGLVVGVWAFGRQMFGRRAGLLAAAVLYAVEVLALTATWPYVDLALGFFGLLAVWALVKWQIRASEGPNWLVVSAIMAVLAAHTKLNGLFLGPALALGTALGLWWRRREARRAGVQVGVAALAGGLLTLVWRLAQEQLSLTITADVSRVVDKTSATVSQALAANGLWAQLGDYLLLPWNLTVLGRQGTAAFDGAITPLFLLLLPLLFLLPRKERPVLSLGLMASAEFVAWALVPRGIHQSRHLILVFPLFSLLAAYAVHRLPEFDRSWFSLSGFFKLVLVLVLSVQVVTMLTWWESYDPLPYLLGLESRTVYLARHLNGGWSPGLFAMMQTIDQTLPADSRIGFVAPESRVFYCPRGYVKFPFRGAETAGEMAAAAEEEGLTHLLVSWQGIEFFANESSERPESRRRWRVFSDTLARFLEDRTVLVHREADSMSLYRVGGEIP